MATDNDKPTTPPETKPVATPPDPTGGQDHILQFFGFAHLPNSLQTISEPFSQLAHAIVSKLPRNPERTVALRKLLEAKDAAVRAFVAK